MDEIFGFEKRFYSAWGLEAVFSPSGGPFYIREPSRQDEKVLM